MTQCRAVTVAGTQTDVGKTSVAVGLMAALSRRGETVQPFKVGPDFIDPTHHRAATGRWSHNLDSWMIDRETNRRLFRTHCQGADVAVVEGVMGLYDGASGGSASGSTAEMARWLELPTVLVVDAWSLARSVAAMVQGYIAFDPELEVAGIVLNRVAGQGHADLLAEALEEVDGARLLGAIPRDDALAIPDRHLGLRMADEAGLPEEYLEKLADAVETHLDVDGLVSEVAAPVGAADREVSGGGQTEARIAVADDEAFCFYYRDNLERLERAGAEIVAFSPLRDPLPDDIDGVYLGGGYPENAPGQLEANRDFLEGVSAFAEAGGPVYAECGGLMVLADWLETRDGERFEMAGIFSWGTRVSERPLMD
ncbi:MAG: cobyrinate a,c-diamide synthase, partial [Bradymonadaceae bacterium]